MAKQKLQFIYLIILVILIVGFVSINTYYRTTLADSELQNILLKEDNESLGKAIEESNILFNRQAELNNKIMRLYLKSLR